MSHFLETMESSSRRRLAAARSTATLEVQRRRAERRRTRALPGGFIVMAEVKPASPAEGPLAESGHLDIALAYESGGASALSVLTEPTEFGGSLSLLDEIAGAVDLPVMRKDFVVDPYQVWEARAHGASGVLAIARMLDPVMLEKVIAAAGDAGMFALVEGFDEDDLALIGHIASGVEGVLVGVNARDLETLQVRTAAHRDLAGHLPEGLPAIAESGISSSDQVSALIDLGYSGVLVGTSLMRSPDPKGAVAALVAAGSRE